MRLYSLSLQCPYGPTGTGQLAIEAHFLAENDRAFLLEKISWALCDEEPKQPGAMANEQSWRDYHESAGFYHKSVADALRNQSIDVDGYAVTWTSLEVTDEQIAMLRDLGIVA